MHPWGAVQRRESSVQSPFQAVLELLKIGDTIEEGEGSFHYQDMEDLMRLGSICRIFQGRSARNACGIEADSGDVHIRAMREEPAVWPTMVALMKSSLSDCKLRGRHDATKLSPRGTLFCLLVLGRNQSHCATMMAEMPRTQTIDADELWLGEQWSE